MLQLRKMQTQSMEPSKLRQPIKKKKRLSSEEADCSVVRDSGNALAHLSHIFFSFFFPFCGNALEAPLFTCFLDLLPRLDFDSTKHLVSKRDRARTPTTMAKPHDR